MPTDQPQLQGTSAVSFPRAARLQERRCSSELEQAHTFMSALHKGAQRRKDLHGRCGRISTQGKPREAQHWPGQFGTLALVGLLWQQPLRPRPSSGRSAATSPGTIISLVGISEIPGAAFRLRNARAHPRGSDRVPGHESLRAQTTTSRQAKGPGTPKAPRSHPLYGDATDYSALLSRLHFYPIPKRGKSAFRLSRYSWRPRSRPNRSWAALTPFFTRTYLNAARSWISGGGGGKSTSTVDRVVTRVRASEPLRRRKHGYTILYGWTTEKL